MKPESAKPIAGLLLLLALGVGITGLILWRDSQPLFQSTAAVRVVRDQTDLEQLGAQSPAGMDQVVFLQTQIEILRSEAVLQKVIAQLELNSKWTNPADPPLESGETMERLRNRTQISPAPGMAVLRIQVASPDRTEAPKLADALVAAYCEYRMERRRRIAQEGIDALAAPYQENAEKVRQASERVEQTYSNLPPALREGQRLAQPNRAEDETLRSLRSQLAQRTMTYIVQSNQLAQLNRSGNFPTNELAKLTAQAETTRNELATLETSLQNAVRQQESLRAYWEAGQDWEKATTIFAPIKKVVEEKRLLLESRENPPAVIEEPAGATIPLPTYKAGASQACLLGAGALLLASAGLFFSARKPAPKP